VKRFSENSETKFKKRDGFTGQTFENNMFVPSRPAKKPDGTGRPAVLSRTVLNPGVESGGGFVNFAKFVDFADFVSFADFAYFAN